MIKYKIVYFCLQDNLSTALLKTKKGLTVGFVLSSFWNLVFETRLYRRFLTYQQVPVILLLIAVDNSVNRFLLVKNWKFFCFTLWITFFINMLSTGLSICENPLCDWAQIGFQQNQQPILLLRLYILLTLFIRTE